MSVVSRLGWPRAAILQPAQAVLAIPAHPLGRRLRAHVETSWGKLKCIPARQLFSPISLDYESSIGHSVDSPFGLLTCQVFANSVLDRMEPVEELTSR